MQDRPENPVSAFSGNHTCGDRVAETTHSKMALMKVAIYNASERYHGYSTGVGRHVIRMVAGLDRHPAFDVSFMVPSDFWERDRLCGKGDILSSVASVRLPLSRRMLAATSLTLNRPRIDTYGDAIDWVYSPREQLVSTRRAATAITIHDVYALEPAHRQTGLPRTRWQEILWKKAVQRASIILTVSEFSKGRICELLGADSARVHVIGNGVEELFFEIAKADPEQISPLADTPYFLVVGGITRKKGASNVLAFASRLRMLSGKARVVVIGPVESPYEAQVRQARNIIRLERGIPDEVIARWLRGAVALLLLSNYEGFGIPALEAMAAGVPVVGNSVASIPEVIGDAGLLIDATSKEQIDDAISLQFDKNLRDELVRRGQDRVEQWRWETCVNRLAQLLLQGQGSYTPTGDLDEN